MTTFGPHTAPALGGLAAGIGVALALPGRALENAGPWVDWFLAPFAQLVYLGLSCF